MPSKSPSVTDLFSNSRFPSALQTEIFLPSQRTSKMSGRYGGERHLSGTANIEDDNESLIDLEQWAMDIRDGSGGASDSGRENAGYVSEDDVNIGSGSEVIVQVHNPESEEERVEQIYASVVTSEVRRKSIGQSIHSKTATSESEYDTPDMIYAKINKQTNRHATSSNVSIHIQSDDEYDITPRGSSMENIVDINAMRRSASVPEIDIDRRSELTVSDVNEVDVYDLKADSISAASVEGALFSQVRSLSARGSPFGSNFNLRDCLNDDKEVGEAPLDIENEEHFQTERFEGFKDSDKDIVAEYEYTVSESAGQFSHEYYTADSIRKEIGLGKTSESQEHARQPNSGSSDLDVNTLEAKLQELQKRQTSLNFNAVNAMSPSSDSTGNVDKQNKQFVQSKSKQIYIIIFQ